MFTNYLKVAIRNLLKNKLHSGINIAGLAVAFAASIIIFLFARNELTYDAFHKKADSIYLVYKERITPTGTQITRDTWMPMARALVQDYPVIEKAARNWASQSWVEV
ncbi:ABC transporter permease, partial [candidate division KSB1 bacterium]|nr:ABC transporter permease [candidate division KSB1 bacterium]NIR70853.1 ABC transporter permease [candidate division KSB1 bacterium]NIS24639.1 ABC transporter permease [candidate division KSB1 bacterium]NIT71541.1 ABC transporter permease [candidate division KSB1 bacterium]NIU25239.1 ABC transporter permease [candidate division KSB1 bacterium]